MRNPYDIIRTARLTEKGTRLTEEHNQYVFEVDTHATKIEIKQAVEAIFKKKVERVNTMRILGKARRGVGFAHSVAKALEILACRFGSVRKEAGAFPAEVKDLVAAEGLEHVRTRDDARGVDAVEHESEPFADSLGVGLQEFAEC